MHAICEQQHTSSSTRQIAGLTLHCCCPLLHLQSDEEVEVVA